MNIMNQSLSCMNTPIIAYTGSVVNAGAAIPRLLYTIEQGQDVCKSSFKHEHGLTHKRVANGPLFNNDTLVYPHGDTCMVGVVYRGAERKYHNIPYVWKKDKRGKSRRYITRKQFASLPLVLQQIAETMGVDVDASYICFARCVVAWAGHNVKGMHVHHVNMDTTDDRLGNLWVMTPQEHAAVHADESNLLWDKDWYEYTSCYGGMLQLDMALTITEDDIAVPLIPDASVYFPPYSEEEDDVWDCCDTVYGVEVVRISSLTYGYI